MLRFSHTSEAQRKTRNARQSVASMNLQVNAAWHSEKREDSKEGLPSKTPSPPWDPSGAMPKHDSSSWLAFRLRKIGNNDHIQLRTGLQKGWKGAWRQDIFNRSNEGRRRIHRTKRGRTDTTLDKVRSQNNGYTSRQTEDKQKKESPQ